MATSYKDYYAILGVERGADTDTIARAFKKLARKFHPDLNPGNKRAEEKFKEINEAYEVLKDPKKRQLYDQLGPDWEHAQQFQQAGGNPFGGFGQGGQRFTFNGQNVGGAEFSDFFQTLFGGGSPFGGAGGRSGGNPFGGFRQPPAKGQDVETSYSMSLEDAQKGGTRSVTLRINGETTTFSVRFPAGIKEGAKIRLAGKGGRGPGGNGDLFLIIKYLPHPEYRIDGNDLERDVVLAPWEAVLGTKARVNTLDGVIELSIPAGTSSGRRLRLRGRGLGPEGKRGDFYARVMVAVPQTSSEEELRLWKQLQEISSFQPRG